MFASSLSPFVKVALLFIGLIAAAATGLAVRRRGLTSDRWPNGKIYGGRGLDITTRRQPGAETVPVERTHKIAVAGSAVLMLAVMFVRLCLLPPARLIGRYMADDAFYYLVVARRFPVPKFSGEVVTTGFHPLWWVLLSPIEAVTDGVSVVRLALSLALVLHVATGLVLWAVFRRWWGAGWVPTVATIVWIVHPGIRSIELFGVESALLGLCLSLVLLAATAPATRRSGLLLGAAAGLCFLARTDSLLVTLPVLAGWGLWHSRRWSQLAWAGVGLVIPASPWVVFLLSQGGLNPDSSRALRIVRDATGGSRSTLRALSPFLDKFLNLSVLGIRVNVPGPPLILLTIVIGLLVCYPPNPMEIALGMGTALVHLLQAHQLGGLREWYAIYLVSAIAVVVFPRVACFARDLVNRLAMGRPAWPRLRVSLLAVLGLLAVAAVVVQKSSWFPQEEDKYNAATLVGQQLGPDERIAAFNTGIYQWVMPQDVVNLDGVMNPDVLPYLRARAICEYLHKLDIRWVIDSENGRKKAEVLAPGLLASPEVIDIPVRADPQFLWAVPSGPCASGAT